MPTYEYACSSCKHEWELEQSIKEDAITQCPSCHHATAKRQISRGGGFILKGGGWYADLYSSGSNKPSGAAGSGATGATGAASGAASEGSGAAAPSTSSEGASGTSGSTPSAGGGGGGGEGGGSSTAAPAPAKNSSAPASS
jgi:putative FmdB family regulatory protein